MPNLKNTKNELFSICKKQVADKINTIKAALNEVQNAANNETKSSAGDKHETGRAMAQLETEKLSKQLAEILKLEQVLHLINPNTKHQIIGLGSLVLTNNGNFYIAVSLGQLKLNHQNYYAISIVSPIAKQLIGLKENDVFTFNKKTYTITHIS